MRLFQVLTFALFSIQVALSDGSQAVCSLPSACRVNHVIISKLE